MADGYDSTVSDLDNLHRQARTARARLEPIWYLDLAFFMNEQWLAWDGRQLYKPSMPKSRITVVDNRITPAVRKELARLTKQRPVFTVTPQSPDEDDANAAKLGEQLMRYLWKHLNLTKLDYKALEWARICGSGFLKCYWDSTVGESTEVLVKSGGGLLNGPDGRPLRPNTPHGDTALQMAPDRVRVKTVAQGDVRVEVRSPFQMFIDPLADTFEEAEWVIEESVKSREYVRRRYGVDIQPDTAANPGLIEARMGAVFMPGTGGYKGLKVREYWCKPNSTHPNGCRTVWVTTGEGKKLQGQVLLTDDKPFDPMPYVMYSGIPVPGRMWPMSVVELLRGPQTELNKVKSQIAENRNRVGNPSILASKQAVQDPEKFIAASMLPGGVIFYDDVGSPNAIPRILEAPALPEYVIEEIQRIEESIQEISGQHEVTNAQVPPGVTAASAINLLQEADDTMLGPSVTDHENELARLGQKILKLVANYYTDARAIRIGGDNGAWEIFDFRGSMLKDNTHVEVQAGSAFPQSKAAKQAWIQNLMDFFVQSGNPPQGRQLAQFLQDSEMGGAEKLVQDFTDDETQVNRENVDLSQGKPQDINPYDNDEAHIAGHTSFQKQARYKQLPQFVQQICELHVEQHRQRVAQQQQAQMQIAQQMSGQPSAEQQQQQAQTEQAQAHQDMANQQQQADMQTAQSQQQMQLKDAQQAQQQGSQQAQSEQTQRQAEELHQQKVRQAEELHQVALRRSHEQGQQESARAEEQRRQQRLNAEQQRKQAQKSEQGQEHDRRKH